MASMCALLTTQPARSAPLAESPMTLAETSSCLETEGLKPKEVSGFLGRQSWSMELAATPLRANSDKISVHQQ